MAMNYPQEEAEQKTRREMETCKETGVPNVLPKSEGPGQMALVHSSIPRETMRLNISRSPTHVGLLKSSKWGSEAFPLCTRRWNSFPEASAGPRKGSSLARSSKQTHTPRVHTIRSDLEVKWRRPLRMHVFPHHCTESSVYTHTLVAR